jgi:hypothetical protein
MLQWVLRTIICYEFEKNVGRNQAVRLASDSDKYSDQPMFGMLMNFCLYNVSDDQEYPKVQMLIFAPMNYVGVYYRESIRDACGPDDESDDRYTEWKRLSYHGSCWRDDGVDRFLSQFGPRINTLDWHKNQETNMLNNEWYERFLVSEELAKVLRAL